MNNHRVQPVILDTDIGGDIDDTWALLQLLRCPELDLRLVLTCSGDVKYRAQLTAKFLEAVGRADVPIGMGRGATGPIDRKWASQENWLGDYEGTEYPGGIEEDGISRMIQIVEQSPVPVTVIGIAEATNLAEFVRRRPDLVTKCRLIGMFGSFRVGYGGSAEPSPERNVREDPAGLRDTLAAPWADVLITPLDTCGIVALEGERYARFLAAAESGRKDLKALYENYESFAKRVIWMKCDFFRERSTTLFDCVAVHLAYDERPYEIELLRFEVTDSGMTRLMENGPCRARIAMRWVAGGQERFLDELLTRLLDADSD